MRYKEISIDFFICRYFDETRRLIKTIAENIGDCWVVLAEPVPSKLISYTVHGVRTMVPENFDAILTACYGEWRVKVKKWDDRNSPCAQKDYTKHDHYESRSREEWVHFLEASIATVNGQRKGNSNEL